MKKIALVARGLTKNGVRSFVETRLNEVDSSANEKYLLFTDEYSFKKKYKNLEVIYIKNRNKIVWDYILSPLYLYKSQVAEVIYPKNIIPLSHALFNWKKTVYVLDLAFKHPELKAYRFLDTLYMNFLLGSSLKIADKIFAISKFTAKEISKYYPEINQNKISVIKLPINKNFKKITDDKKIRNIKNKYKINKKFIFYCGSISPRKNILNLLKAFNEIKNELPHDLYLVSSRSWNSNQIFSYLKNNLKNRVKIIENVTDEELAVFYSIADLFVYPSLYEGFGLPIKEAEACGCKVLTSDFGAMKEVAAFNTILVNTRNYNKLAQAIEKCLI